MKVFNIFRDVCPGWALELMFGEIKGFKPSQNYSKEEMRNRVFQYGKGLQCPASTFANIITREHLLRESVQEEEFLITMRELFLEIIHDFGREKPDLRNTACELVRLFKRNVEDIEREIEKAKAAIYQREWQLYHAEMRLPRQPLKDMYEEIREDPAWYLQKDLIAQCMRNGGCCSRGCNCCENRLWNSERSKGVGHCTGRCQCCRESQGRCGSFKHQEKPGKDGGGDDKENGYRDRYNERDILIQALECPDPACLLKMIEIHFSKLRRPLITARVKGRLNPFKRLFKFGHSKLPRVW
ncbi:hypothetical protein N7495_008320 [Penicillium taxi]|uniref:uncharacterized protein n=1 Tax=Penicillium taxi TaxID=168475 RepID=UPI002545054C|nr:uncharacterized protein N7495_008320 [Penicillium taxi]KAJ5888279.1 hypothetical protein N7495_008320 [Penicillium taxi]